MERTAHSSTMDSMVDGVSRPAASQPGRQRTLLSLPGEIRALIYRLLFKCSKPLPLVVNDDGCMVFTRKIKLSIQLLRVCKDIYLEASPVLYGNSFSIKHHNVDKLTLFRQETRILIKHLIVEGPKDREHAGFINIPAIGQALPRLRHLEIVTYRPSTLLINTLKLAKSLPCSPIRSWPRLVVEVETINEDPTDGSNGVARVHSKLFQEKGFKLDSLDSRPLLRLGHEMPDYPLITIRGGLTSKLIWLLESYTSAFGDCAFERMPQGDNTAKKKGSTIHTYVWHRRDDPAELTPVDDEAAIQMHRWVPRVPFNWRFVYHE